MTSYFARNIVCRSATVEDCHHIASLALIAGEGIPAFFWSETLQSGERVEDVGAAEAGRTDQNFSYLNCVMAETATGIAGMLLAYRLPPATQKCDMSNLPAFIRPLIELEEEVPDSFYINMLAVYPAYRKAGIGEVLMAEVDARARSAGCDLSSLEVFEENGGAVRFYQRLGYETIDSRAVVAHDCCPHDGRILLMTRRVAQV